MPLINIKPNTPAPDRAVQPMKPLQYKPVVIDNRYTGQENLRGYVEASPISVHYYQLLNDGITGTYGYDSEKSATLQQFIKIHALETRLDGEILPQQNPTDKTFTNKGDMYITSGVVPNEGDVFCYEAGDGRYAIWQINQTERMSAVNNAVYRVSFQMLFYTTDPRYQDLENKVVENLWFIKDYANFGRSAVVTTGDFETLKTLHRLQEDMARDYIRDFFNREHAFMDVPGQAAVTYDPFVVQAFRDLLDPSRHPELDRVRFYTYTLDEYQAQYTLWDVLMQRRKELLVGCRTTSRYVNANAFPGEPMLWSMRYSGAQKFVIPGSYTEANHDTKWRNVTVEWNPGEGQVPTGPADLMLPTPIEGEASKLPMLHPVCKDGYYVLSGAFYNKQVEGFSLLEKLLWDYLDNQYVRADHVRHIASNYRAWPSVRRFYYTPLVLLLIQIVMQNAGPPVYSNQGKPDAGN